MRTRVKENLHKDIAEIKKDISIIKNLLEEDYELSDFAKKALKEARESPGSKYVDLE